MKSDYIVRARKFMEAFYPYMCRYYSIHTAVANFNFDYHRKVEYRCGAVRGCLVTSDYVIKWDYDKNNSKLYGGCYHEYRAYVKARRDGYAYLLCPVARININHHFFYVMPRINKFAEDMDYADFDDYWTEDETRYLFAELMIDDMHNGNWGLYKGKAIVTDYAMNCFMHHYR